MRAIDRDSYLLCAFCSIIFESIMQSQIVSLSAFYAWIEFTNIKDDVMQMLQSNRKVTELREVSGNVEYIQAKLARTTAQNP